MIVVRQNYPSQKLYLLKFANQATKKQQNNQSCNAYFKSHVKVSAFFVETNKFWKCQACEPTFPPGLAMLCHAGTAQVGVELISIWHPNTGKSFSQLFFSPEVRVN